ncbi:MAG: ATP-binding cassette domain-containing protein [bacterium]|nr:ATP-binding cassette domain-containing protein [bacterium]
MLEQTNRTVKSTFARRCKPLQFEDVVLEINGITLIHQINCTLEASGKTVVLGPNGAGKSLFLRLMTGLMEPTNGSITGGLEEQEGALTSYQDNGAPCMSLVFQNPIMLRRTAYENIAFVLRHHRVPKLEIAGKVAAALSIARLETRAQVPARRLSGGEQQRLALARTLIINPHALLLDEPTASLDPLSTSIVEDMIEQADGMGTKIVFVTHDIKQAKRMADDILFIHEGRVLAHKSKRDFFKDPGSKQAQAYLDGRVLEK